MPGRPRSSRPTTHKSNWPEKRPGPLHVRPQRAVRVISLTQVTLPARRSTIKYRLHCLHQQQLLAPELSEAGGLQFKLEITYALCPGCVEAYPLRIRCVGPDQMLVRGKSHVKFATTRSFVQRNGFLDPFIYQSELECYASNITATKTASQSTLLNASLIALRDA